VETQNLDASWRFCVPFYRRLELIFISKLAYWSSCCGVGQPDYSWSVLSSFCWMLVICCACGQHWERLVHLIMRELLLLVFFWQGAWNSIATNNLSRLDKFFENLILALFEVLSRGNRRGSATFTSSLSRSFISPLAYIRNWFVTFKSEVIFYLRSANKLGVLESFSLLNIHAFHERARCASWLLLRRFAVVVACLDRLVRGGYCTNWINSLAANRIACKGVKALGII
jgi:hypothetical protein